MNGAKAALRDSLPLVMTVGFAGHIAIDRDPLLDQVVSTAIHRIRDAFIALQQMPLPCGDETLGQAYQGAPALRMLCGSAPGSDRIAQELWAASESDRTHLIFPFRGPTPDTALTDDPNSADAPIVSLPADGSAWTGLDGVGLDLRGDLSHAEVARWIVRHSDLLLAIWQGGNRHGQGGTGDVVRHAIDRGLPVVWVEPGATEPLLITPRSFSARAELDTLLNHPHRHAEPFTAELLAQSLAVEFAPPCGQPPNHAHTAAIWTNEEVSSRRTYAAAEAQWRTGESAFWFARVLRGTVWSAFRWFRMRLGRRKGWTQENPPPETPVREDALTRMAGCQRLDSALDAADQHASLLGDIHRSEQLLFFALVPLTVLIGASPALAPPAFEHPWHITAAALELVLSGIAVLRWLYIRRADRHVHWSDARRLAERLRAARAMWPLGADVTDLRPGPPQTWTEWRARAVLRAAGPPTGWIGSEEVKARLEWARRDLIEGQAYYHAREAFVNRRLGEVLSWVTTMALGALLAGLSAFVVMTLGFRVEGGRFAAFLQVLSAFAPALMAACLGIEATNGFESLERRSDRLKARFRDLSRTASTLAPHALPRAQHVLREAAELLVEDADSWRDRVETRKLVIG